MNMLVRSRSDIPDLLLPPFPSTAPAEFRVVFEQPAHPVGVILNGRAHRNRNAASLFGDLPSHVSAIAPASRRDLDGALARLAARGVETLIVSGGDGTVRDVLTAAAAHFRVMPRMAVVPSGKTNALAIDLGIPKNWTLDDAIRAAGTGETVSRAPIVVERLGCREPALRGFLFGAGAFVRATSLAQDTHRLGAFNGLAVGLTLTGAVAQTLFGGRNNHWRRGDRMRIDLSDGRHVDRSMYLLLGSTLTRLPLGIKPFGRVRGGLKLLGVDAPPKLLAATLPAVLAGSEAAWIAARGYHRMDTSALRLHLDSGFVLDGERYEGGDMAIREGEPIEFLVPQRA